MPKNVRWIIPFMKFGMVRVNFVFLYRFQLLSGHPSAVRSPYPLLWITNQWSLLFSTDVKLTSVCSKKKVITITFFHLPFEMSIIVNNNCFTLHINRSSLILISNKPFICCMYIHLLVIGILEWKHVFWNVFRIKWL